MRLSRAVRWLLLCAPAVVMLASCDGSSPIEPVPVSEAIEPSADYTYHWGSLTLVTSSAFTLLELSNYAVIGPEGGRLRLGFHELTVPRGAVAAPTRFRITAKFGASPIVDLNAVDLASGDAVTQFPIKLQLKLSYLMVPVRREHVHRLVVVWLKDESPNGELVPQPTTYVPSQYAIVGWLSHFSQFSMAMN